MDIIDATVAYEAWLDKQLSERGLAIIPRDLDKKHRSMEDGVFAFLRATFYRWPTLWYKECADLAKAPTVLSVGDLHVENFGTWRDTEGRLVWGLNDADEAAVMPYTQDLVRLATSAILAIAENELKISARVACARILSGYSDAMADREAPAFVIEERYPALREMAYSGDREPQKFWRKLEDKLCPVPVDAAMRRLLVSELPPNAKLLEIAHRTSGLGSLGRPRYLALALANNALVAREAKPLLPSAYDWALGNPLGPPQTAKLLLDRARCPDPFLRLHLSWLMRRIAPRSSRIELKQLPGRRDEKRLLKAMGRETAKLHRSGGGRDAFRKHLNRLDDDWLLQSARRMAAVVTKDWDAWCGNWKKHFPKRRD